MLYCRPRVVTAGLKGGSGKTTLSLGLLKIWREKGLSITPFKKGPDYIDAGWLSASAGKNCYNLDTFIVSKERILESFLSHSSITDASLIEGNRGLYDGFDSRGTHSTASLCKLLKAPLILIIDCTKATSTIAVIARSLKDFDRELDIRGIVLNHIANRRHESVIREAVEYYSDLTVLGAIKKHHEQFSDERHMGLISCQEYPEVEKKITEIAKIIKESVDTEKIWQICHTATDLDYPEIKHPGSIHSETVKIGIIKDSAFQFYYPDNLEQLTYSGAEIMEISSLEHIHLPEIDAMYIGGGFPETNAINISENTSFRNELKKAIEAGLPVYAECGGLMFLGKSITYNGKSFPMVNIFPLDFVMGKRPSAHGYTVVEVTDSNPYFKKGTTLKGHEFHYSKVSNISNIDKINTGNIKLTFKMKRGYGIVNGMDGLVYKNVLATYTHLHALGSADWVEGLIKAAKRYKKRRKY